MYSHKGECGYVFNTLGELWSLHMLGDLHLHLASCAHGNSHIVPNYSCAHMIKSVRQLGKKKHLLRD